MRFAFACIIYFLSFISFCNVKLYAQDDSLVNKVNSVTDISSKAISGLEKEYAGIENNIDKHSAKLLTRLQKAESKLQQKLQRKDSTKAKEIFTTEVKQKYQDLKNNLTTKTQALKKFPLKEYVPGLDSMQTSLSFLLKNKNLPADKIAQLKALTLKLKDLQGQLQKANDIQSFIKERESRLKEQLLNAGFAKQLKGINKQAFYYQARLTECKSLLNDKEKRKEKILATVRNLPAFQKFWQKNSYLAALFPAPNNAGEGQAIAGLQTRASIQNVLAQRIGNAGGAGVNPQQYFQQSVDAAQAQITQLKNKLSKFTNGGGNSDMTMPDFKPNDQKTKSFLKRLQYGFNVQSQQGRYRLPVTSDIAATVGYKISDSKTIGLGASYKIGWGSGIKDIHLSSEGVGLRSYVDIKAKGSIWITGGFEYNYFNAFKSFRELKDNVNIWQKSALLGISKKFKIGKKKEENMQLLYDFLHNQQSPPGQALKFRVGYTFK